MYYSMNGTGSIGEAVLIDSQNPTAGAYNPATHQPVNTTVAPTAKWWERLFTTADKALDTFNPNIPTPAPTPKTNWMGIVGPLVLVGAAVGIAYYATKPKKSK